MIKSKMPWQLRSVNGIGHALNSILPGGLLPLDEAGMKQLAQKRTGLQDFDPDPQFNAGLSQLLNSLKQDANLSLFGRLIMRDVVSRSLGNRLLWAHWRKTRPELFQTTLRAPLIVLGMPRTGTTFLHRLLALDPQGRALPMWELNRPFVPLQEDKRQADTQRAFPVLYWAAPDLQLIHPSGADAAEECMLLLETSMLSMSFWVYAPVYSYLEWWQKQDQTGPYQIYAQTLRYLQAQTPQQRMILKAPAHTMCVQALLAAVPDAMIVQTHRDPGVVIPSFNSFLQTLHNTVSSKTDDRRLGQANADFLYHMLQECRQARTKLRSEQVLDVNYPDLVQNPLQTVQRIYQHFGLEMSAEHEQKIKQALLEDKHGKSGKHEYRAEDFGQSVDQLRSRFSGLVPAAALK